MRCEVPGCMNEACKNVQVRGIFSGIYLDKVLHVCDDHKSHTISAAVYAKNAPLVNPYTEAQKLKKTGS